MRHLFFPLLLLLAAPLSAQKVISTAELCAAPKRAALYAPPAVPDPRSDSVDIFLTQIHLDLTNFTQQRLAARTYVLFNTNIQHVRTLRLDLLGLTVDSVKWHNGPVNWTYDGQVIQVNFPQPLDTAAVGPEAVTVWYQGQPTQDASGWGGFYWQNGYAYNLGVGFAADPHNYGRVWFPCFDNFTERCAFITEITSPADKPGFGNGLLMANETLPNGNLRRTWQCSEHIPSYLACVAVGPYITWQRTLTGEEGPIKVQIATPAADTNKVNGSFVNLPAVMACYEHWYGPYRWPKVGYSLVPFNSGAMEHATNIAYPRATVDGGLTYETLYGHELSHHWWGDLATCSTAEEMWLNEGWASYSEHLLTEWLYGPDAYRQAVGANFLDVLQTAHLEEGGYRAVNNLPHEHTYGKHVYNKGAVIGHNLRAYLGDSLFRVGLRGALEQTGFADWTSADLRDRMSNATGVDLTDFFDDWVFQPGFADFTVDSTQVLFSPVDAPTVLRVWVKQRLRGATHLYQNVPLEFTILGLNGERAYRQAVVSGESTLVEFEFPAWGSFQPKKVWLNTRLQLTQARAEQEKNLTSTGNSNFAPAKMDLKINALGADSVRVRVEYHFSRPDTGAVANPLGFDLTNRFWVIDSPTDWPAGLDLQGSVFYDGRGQQDQLDTELFAATGPDEGSVKILYRPGAGHPWTEWTDVVKNTLGSTPDRWGQFRINHLQPGEYTVAKGGISSTFTAPETTLTDLVVSPNPTRDYVQVRAGENIDNVLIFNSKGEQMPLQNTGNATQWRIAVRDWPAGVYQAVVQGVSGRVGASAVVVLAQ